MAEHGIIRYRRDYTEGAAYFFTVVMFRCERLFDDWFQVAQLRAAFRAEMTRCPFSIDAIAIMPDHIHTLWTLPPGDAAP